MAEVLFTADTHFGHESMVSKGWRPSYASVTDMDDDLIRRWNKVVDPKDTVWHLGDFGMGRLDRWSWVLPELNGTIHLIAGNHDAVWPGHRDAHKHQRAWLDAGFASVQSVARRRVDGTEVLLAHLPYTGDHQEDERFPALRLRDTGRWLLHGHVHSEWGQRGRQINVGVDVRGFAPVPMGTIVDLIRQGES